MTVKNTFVTIVTHIDNVELRKDTGQIPYHFSKLGYDAKLVSYYYTLDGGRMAGPLTNPPQDKEIIKKDYPYLESEVKGLKIDFIPNLGRGKFYEKSVLNYLKKNAKNITILNLFHFSSQSIFYTLIYKLLNPKGKVYLKLDISIVFFETQISIFNTAGKFNELKNLIYNQVLIPLFFKLVTMISAESDKGLEYFKKRFKVRNHKITLIPNGVDLERFYSLSNGLNKFEEKENILISVGVIGDENKNHTLLLNVLPSLDLSKWTVYFIGLVTTDFQIKINLFFNTHPDLKHKVHFTGVIRNSAILCNFYNRAKIFCMPSKSEGFPISAVEAAVFGNILLLNEKIHAFNTLTDHGKNGLNFNEDNIVEVLSLIMNDEAMQFRMY